MRILVVDDHYATRRLFWRALKTEQCKVETASNVKEAFDAINNNGFDLVFIDVDLDDEIDGIELAKIFRNRRPDLRIVIMSGRLNIYEPKARAKNFNEFLAKPFSLEEMKALVFQAEPS